MTNIECEKFVQIVLEFGRRMLESGAEVRRVEDTIERLCNAYGFSQCQVYAVVNQIILTVGDSTGRHYTQQIRVKDIRNDLGLLEELNGAARSLCNKKANVFYMLKSLSEIENIQINPLYELGGHMIASSSFAIFFGGNVNDGLAAALISLVVYGMNKIFSKSSINNIVYTVVACFVSGWLGIFFCRIGIGSSFDKIMIGDVMLFIPGLAIVNGAREIVYRDIFTGLFRLVEAVLVAAAIALGFGLAIFPAGGNG